MKITQLDTAMTMWPPGTRHYRDDSGGGHYAVHADSALSGAAVDAINTTLSALGQPTVQSGVHTVVQCPTTIVACNAEGIPTDLTPLHTYPPGTTAEDALAQAGFEVQ